MGAGESTRRPLTAVQRGVAQLSMLVAIALGSSCSDEFQSCEALRTCDEDARQTTDAGRDALAAGSGGRGAGGVASSGGVGVTGGAPPSGGALSGGAGGLGGSAGRRDAGGEVDGGDRDSSIEGGKDSSTPVDGQDAPMGCPAGQRACGAAGCVDVGRDPDHCGACDAACAETGTARRACVAGECQPTCASDRVDCNADGRDGCEADLGTDPDHCGGCDVVCESTGVSARVCEGGACKPVCLATHRDCNAIGRDGCEINVQNNVNNCGACARSCSSAGASQRRCVAGACAPTCSAGLGDCSTPGAQVADDGCEADVTLDTRCGTCTRDCQGAECTEQLTCSAVQVEYVAWSHPMSLEVTDEHVFWSHEAINSNAGYVSRKPVGGGSVATAFQAPDLVVRSMVFDGESLYIGDASDNVNRGIFRATPPAISSWSPLVKQDDLPAMVPNHLALAGSQLYWSDDALGRIFRVPKDGSGPPISITPEQALAPTDLRADDTHLYYRSGSELVRIPLVGAWSSPTPVASSGPFALTATHVYATLQGTPWTLQRRQKSLQGAWQRVAELAAEPSKVVIFGSDAYVALIDGTVHRVAISGGAPLQVANVSGAAIHMKVQNGVLYWGTKVNDLVGYIYRMVL